MQALSLAMGPAGITYFTQQLVAQHLINALAGMTPPPKTVPVGDFNNSYPDGTGGIAEDSYANVSITLSNGSLSGFKPGYQSITQTDGSFQLTLLANAFTANYNWREAYQDTYCDTDEYDNQHCQPAQDYATDLPYAPTFGSLTAVLTLGFQYDQQNNSYDVVLVAPAGGGSPVQATPAGVQANIPASSIIQYDTTGTCGAETHIDDATMNAVSSIDWSTAISKTFGPLIESIAASGQLTPNITYNFAVGDSGLSFPGGKGLAIGITGNVAYQDTPYPGTPPVGLPVPPPPTDHHHLQLYVSNYEIDALYWAFYQDGKLAVTVQPTDPDLPDPDVLKCKTYEALIPALKQYVTCAMKADVVPKQAPTIAFQQVWVLSTAAMATLQSQLPGTVYTMLLGLTGNGYLAEADLNNDVQAAGITEQQYPQTYQQYWLAIEEAAAAAGMVMTQDLEFTLTILNNATTQPNIVFDLARTDILQNLQLGVAQWLLDDSTNPDTTMPRTYRVQPDFTPPGTGPSTLQLAVYDNDPHADTAQMLFALPYDDLSLLADTTAPPTLVEAFAESSKNQKYQYTLVTNAPITAQVQTLQFADFTHVSYTATFQSSTVPGFPAGAVFADVVWPTVGEPHYDEAMCAIGTIGMPLPIMSGFQFLFEDAELSIQEKYVSVLAQVRYDGR
jgi:hypothetical protein